MSQELSGLDANYYKLPENASELQDLIEYRNMNFACGNIFKAVWRLGSKPGTSDIYDLEKVIFFANREIERRKKLLDAEKKSQMFLKERGVIMPNSIVHSGNVV